MLAAETRAKDGLHLIESACVLEVLEPNTAEPVSDGEKGELVVTSLTRLAMPVLRFRTGDLTLKGAAGAATLPRGVFGRTDAMVKVKGVKVYPRELLFLCGGNRRAKLPPLPARCWGVARGAPTARCCGSRATPRPTHETSRGGFAAPWAVGMNDIRVEEAVEGDLVVDERF